MTRATLTCLAVALLGVLLTSCAALWDLGNGPQRVGTSSSLVEFLYPDGETPPPPDDRLPELRLPMRVGLAFVPAKTGATGGLSEARKQGFDRAMAEMVVALDHELSRFRERVRVGTAAVAVAHKPGYSGGIDWLLLLLLLPLLRRRAQP